MTSQGGAPPRAVPAVPARCHLHGSGPSPPGAAQPWLVAERGAPRPSAPLPNELLLSWLQQTEQCLHQGAWSKPGLGIRDHRVLCQACREAPAIPLAFAVAAGPHEVLPRRDARGSFELPL